MALLHSLAQRVDIIVGVKIKLADTKEAEAAVAANLQARQEDADTFRGIHLDPNAHHWDEVCRYYFPSRVLLELLLGGR